MTSFMKPISFASDNNSEVIPEVLEAIESVNTGQVAAYGNDSFTDEVRSSFKRAFGDSATTFLVFNGTAANILCLKALLKSYEGVICAESSHLNHDECGAPEHIIGTKLLTLPSPNGKLQAKDISTKMVRLGDPHCIQPRVVSITQPTEYGTIYSIQEMKDIKAECVKYGLKLHIDGSRLVNAATALGVSLKEITSDIGADAVSFGGTKNGLLLAEACVFFDKQIAKHVPFYQKQLLQLPGKSRFIAAQFQTFLKDETWRRYSQNSIERAREIHELVKSHPNVEITQNPDTNMVFAKIPRDLIHYLREKYFFYIWNEKTNEVRWVTSWSTTSKDVQDFAKALQRR